MRLGINTFLFTSPFTNDSTKLFKQFKQWGFDTIEIPIEDPSHIDPAHVKRELDKHGLVCGSVCACLGPDRDLRGTPKQQKTSLDYLKKVIDQMVVLECPSLIGPVYSVRGPRRRRAAGRIQEAMEDGGEESQDALQTTPRSGASRSAWNRSTALKPTSSTPATRP